MDIASFYQQSHPLMQAVNEFAVRHAVGPLGVADHLCFKCASSEEYERMRALLEPEAHFVYQSYIGKRRIAILKFRTLQFDTSFGSIRTLELSDQKPDQSQKSGFDHVEIYSVSGSYEDLVHALHERGAVFEETHRPHHTTHDLKLPGRFTLKLTREPLLDKIKRDEMI